MMFTLLPVRAWLGAISNPTRVRKVIQATAVVLCGGLLTVAALLEPDPRGLGTHERAGLPPCTFHQITGLPCPGCGMTTAFANAVRLRFAAAFLANPFGMLLCAAAAALGLFSLVCLVTDWSAWSRLRRLETPLVVWGVLALLLASWGFEILLTLLRRSGGSE